MSALITSRDSKGLHTISLFEAAYNKTRLDESRAQQLNERGGEFQDGIAKLIAELTMPNRYADEEVVSSYGYLSGYKPVDITVQTDRLRELFSGIGQANNSIVGQWLPEGAEGWFAIPRWEKIARTYGEAVQKVLDLIKQAHSGKFQNYREGQLGPHYLRQSERSLAAWKQLGETQESHDILVVPAQFGLLHRGRSVRRACEVMNASEFGLGAFAIGVMLLAHPERLQHYNDLWIDCAGDEFSPEAMAASPTRRASASTAAGSSSPPTASAATTATLALCRASSRSRASISRILESFGFLSLDSWIHRRKAVDALGAVRHHTDGPFLLSCNIC